MRGQKQFSPWDVNRNVNGRPAILLIRVEWSMRSSSGCFYLVFFVLSAFFFIHPAGAAGSPAHSGYEVWHGELNDKASDLAISDDGSTVTAGSEDGTIYVTDRSGNLLWAYNNMRISAPGAPPANGGDKWVSVAVSGDGKYIVAGIRDLGQSHNAYSASPKILFFDRGGRMLWNYSASSVQDVGITADGDMASAIAEYRVVSFNRDGSLIWRLTRSSGDGAIAVSRDGSFVAWTDGYDNAALIDSTGTAVWEEKMKNTLPYSSQKISTGGSAVLVDSNGLFDKTGRLWNYTGSTQRHDWSGAASSDGNYSVLGEPGGRVSLIDRQGTFLWTKNVSSSDYTTNVAISGDGSVIGVLCGRALTLMTNNGDRIWTAEVAGDPYHIALSADGQSIVTTSGSTLYFFKKNRDTINPPFTADLKSGVRYDGTSYIGGYVYPKYVTPDNLLVGVVIIGILAAAGFGFRRMKKYVREHPGTLRFSKWTWYLLISIAVFCGARLLNLFFAGYYSGGIFGTGSPVNNVILIITSILTIGALAGGIISVGAKIIGFFRKK